MWYVSGYCSKISIRRWLRYRSHSRLLAIVPKSLLTNCCLRPPPFLLQISACVPPLFKDNISRRVTVEPVKREKMSVFAGTVLASFLLLRCRPDTTYEVDWALKPLPYLLTLLLRFQPFLLVLWCFASFWCSAFRFSWKCVCSSGLVLYLFLFSSCDGSPCVSFPCFGLFWSCSSTDIVATKAILPLTVLFLSFFSSSFGLSARFYSGLLLFLLLLSSSI